MRNFSRQVKFVEEGGIQFVLVAVNRRCDKYAFLYRSDWDFLSDGLGISPNWCTIGNDSVCCSSRNNTKISVARLLADAGPSQVVRFKDGNPLNLRSENIGIEFNKRATRRDRDLVPLKKEAA